MSVKMFDRLQKSRVRLRYEYLNLKMVKTMKKIFVKFSLNLALSCAFIAIAFSCAPSNVSNPNYSEVNLQNIIGGQDLGLNSKATASVVAIIDTSSLGSFSVCTGVFIKKDIILTAAHCVSQNPSDMLVKLGNSIFSEKKSSSLVVKNIIKHPKYQIHKNDLALIQIHNDKNILTQPVLLATDSEIQKPNNFIVFGYGVKTTAILPDDQMQGVGILRKLKILSKFILNEKNKFIVDQSKGYGVCGGDSGGPAFILNEKNKYILAGVASGLTQDHAQSDSQTECQHKSEFTKVADYKAWIFEAIEYIEHL